MDTDGPQVKRDILDRPLPHNIEAEQAVIGSMLLDNVTIPVVAAVLKPDSYLRHAHQRMHAAIADMHAAGVPIDPVTLAAELRRRGHLEETPDSPTGGLTIEYIVETFEQTPTAANAEYYARIVREHWIRRRQIQLGSRLIRAGHDPAGCADELAEIEAELTDLRGADARSNGCAALWDDEIITRPAARYLVDGILVERSLAMLSGPEGAGKSFIALAIAQCVAAGLPWLGRCVRQGPVVYVAGEGIGGLPIRVRAWRQHHDHESRAGVMYRLDAVQLADAGEVGGLIALTRKLPAAPMLVILDTLARCSVGMDENSTQDMGRVIAGCDRIIRETGAAVLLLHHDARGTGRARGSTAVVAAMDTILSVSGDGVALTLKTAKQKDAAPLPPITLRLERVQLSETESSCVVIDDCYRVANTATKPEHRSVLDRAYEVLLKRPDGETASKIADEIGLSGTNRAKLKAELDAKCAENGLEPCKVSKRSGNRTEEYDGYRLVADARMHGQCTDNTDGPGMR